MQTPLVSLVTPCFNTDRFIHRLLDSVLKQSYPNIEMFVVDDGSTDESKNVILSYVPLFEEKGYSLHYLYQKNAGMSAAIQNALQFVNGKYLAWPDSDDFYAANDAIEKMVATLDSAPNEIAVVRMGHYFLDENDLHVVGARGVNEDKIEEKSFFEDCLFQKNGFYFCAGAYMVDFTKLLNSTELPMFSDKNAGQNWQLLLPILWNFRCASISEKLFSVLIRSSSHSRGQYIGYEKMVARFSAFSDTILSTLDKIKGMPSSIRDSYKAQIRNKYLKQFLLLSFQYGKKSEFDDYFKQIGVYNLKNLLLKLLVHLRMSKLIWKIYIVCAKIKRMFLR